VNADEFEEPISDFSLLLQEQLVHVSPLATFAPVRNNPILLSFCHLRASAKMEHE
jgi:hypothetical protein